MKKVNPSDIKELHDRINYLQEMQEGSIIIFNVLRNELIAEMKEIKTALKNKNILD